MHLQPAATALTGNDERILEIDEDELGGGRIEPVLKDVLREGVELVGSRRKLQRLVEWKRGRR